MSFQTPRAEPPQCRPPLSSIAPRSRPFAATGFVHLQGLLDPAEIGRLREAVDAAVAARKRNDARALAEKSLYEQSFVQCQYLWEDFPDVRPLTFHPKIVSAAALIGADAMRLWHDQALYKEAGGARPTPTRTTPIGRSTSCAR